MSEKMIFCLGSGKYKSKGEGYQKNHMAWNKSVSETRYQEILKEVKEILKDFKLDARESWSSEWQKVRSSQWEKLAKIPEFDLGITKKITGLENIQTDQDDEVTITVEGKEKRISRKSAIALNLLSPSKPCT